MKSYVLLQGYFIFFTFLLHLVYLLTLNLKYDIVNLHNKLLYINKGKDEGNEN